MYVPGGNPAPDFATGPREGANLYSGSIVVLDAKTGAYKNHFKLVPKDWHDWDVSTAPALIQTKGGKKLLSVAPKDGHIYGFDVASNTMLYRTPSVPNRERRRAVRGRQGGPSSIVASTYVEPQQALPLQSDTVLVRSGRTGATEGWSIDPADLAEDPTMGAGTLPYSNSQQVRVRACRALLCYSRQEMSDGVDQARIDAHTSAVLIVLSAMTCAAAFLVVNGGLGF